MSDRETLVMSQTCAVHNHREWVPINIHHIHPRGLGGPNTAANKVAVCMNGHGSIHEYIRRLQQYGRHVPDANRFGARVRKLALRGWVEAGEPGPGANGGE